jgi:hypothetical protein
MKKLVGPLAVLTAFAFFALALPAHAQRPAGEHPAQGAHPAPGGPSHAPAAPSRAPVGGGHIPAHGPASHTPLPSGGKPDMPGHPTAPHVDPGTDRWVGHVPANHGNYHLDHPWEHGHFPGHVGAGQVWRLGGGGPSRFGFGGFFFSVAPADVGYCDGWDWNTDDIILYPDPDDDGWYLAYNVRLGIYVHVEYLGS